jgi:hypothetical protein
MKIKGLPGTALLAMLLMVLSACAPTAKVTTTQAFTPGSDGPFQKILVVALAEKFDPRREFERTIISQLAEKGTVGIASTSMMDSRTPLVRQTFVDMVEKVGADAVLVSQILDLSATPDVKAASPEATYNIRPTWYYNVFTVELTEYTEPRVVDVTSDLALATSLISVRQKAPIWAIHSETSIKQRSGDMSNYAFSQPQAKGIVDRLARDKLIK